MAQHWSEGVSTLRFTSREHQQELVEAALKHNLLSFVSPSATAFVSLKLIQEFAYQIRRPSKRKTVVIAPIYKLHSMAIELSHLTELKTIAIKSIEECDKFTKSLANTEVLFCNSEILAHLLDGEQFTMFNINLLVIEQCHMVIEDVYLQKIMSLYKKLQLNSPSHVVPKILAFTHPLFTSGNKKDSNKNSLECDRISKEYLREYLKDPIFDRVAIIHPEPEVSSKPQIQLECLKGFTDISSKDSDIECVDMNSFCYWRTTCEEIVEVKSEDITGDDAESEKISYEMLEYLIKKLENMLCCQADMASDIVGLKRITGKPKEVIIECNAMMDDDKCVPRQRLEKFMRNVVAGALMFLKDHRYDPTEIYGEETFSEELQDIPDPCREPREMLELFLYVLEEAGPYAADKAALTLLIRLEKLKIKIPYERHFLILCLVTSVFLQIRAVAESIIDNYPTEKEKIQMFSTPKVLRLFDILKLFKPPNGNKRYSDVKSSPVKKEMRDISTQKSKTVNDNSSERANCNSPNLVIDNSSQAKKIHSDVIQLKSKSSNSESRLSNDKTDMNANSDKTEKNNRNSSNTYDTSSLIEKSNIDNTLQQINKCDLKIIDKKLEVNSACNSDGDTSPEFSSCKSKQLVATDVTDDDTTESISLQVVDEESIKNIKPYTIRIISNVDTNVSITYGKSESARSIKGSPSKKFEGNYRGRGRGRGGKGYGGQYRHYYNNNNDPDALCGLLFVENTLLAKILSILIFDYCRGDEDLSFICGQYTIAKTADPLTDPKEAENEHKLQEEILKRFRTHECNLLIGTAFLEEGMDLPKCNLVIRWDIPDGYRSYSRCRARARAPRSLYTLLAPQAPELLVKNLAQYSYIEKILIKKCGWREPPASEEADASRFSSLLESYRPSVVAVNLSSAVALLNRYCAKLPSDTFTRLVPLWTMERIIYHGILLYICTIRLPINCPLKHQIVGHPMPNRVLARRTAALQACRALHKAGELDDNLMPIGKEGFRAMESDWLSLPPVTDLPRSVSTVQAIGPMLPTDKSDLQTRLDYNFEPRPGTTKRKQYYYKKVAQAFTACRPIVGKPCLAYQINAWLACQLPERHNTRGRKLHPPEIYAEGFAILTSKPIQEIPIFPIFTRSGEVRVALQKLPGEVIITAELEGLIHYFMKYTFAEVLRVHNHLMLFDEEGKQIKNSFYIVPTIKATDNVSDQSVKIDWNFLQLIHNQTKSDSILSLNKEKSMHDADILQGLSEDIRNAMNFSDITSKEKEPLIVIENSREDHEHMDEKIETTVNKLNHNHLDDSKQKINDDVEDIGDVADNVDDVDEEVKELLPNPYLAPDETFVFDSEKFRDAVVMPWYRNQDQPQYFYVAEICWNLSPLSAFPSAQHSTFEQYYRRKYGVQITQPTQPLLDVDHTSARLNLLTPRFVNRKGVALPTSSERTKRAKRESLEQKQILVPELCCAHPFRGALWRAAVALPCVLYRINSLLLADEIRRSVALCVALGTTKQEPGFKWPSLDFGWSLADVIADEKDTKIESLSEQPEILDTISENHKKEIQIEVEEKADENQAVVNEKKEKTANELLKEKDDAIDGETGEVFEIGTWSNDMAASVPEFEPEITDYEEDQLMHSKLKLPENLTICTTIGSGADWSLSGNVTPPPVRTPPRSARKYSMADSDISYLSSDYDSDDGLSNMSDSDSDDDVDISINALGTLKTLDTEKGGIRIEFKSVNEAEAIEIPSTNLVKTIVSENTVDPLIEREAEEKSMTVFKNFFYSSNIEDEDTKQHVDNFKSSIAINEMNLIKNGILVSHDKSLDYLKPQPYSGISFSKSNTSITTEEISPKKVLRNKKTTINSDTYPLDSPDEYVEDDDVNPFLELKEMALSKKEIQDLYQEMFPYKSELNDTDWENQDVFENGIITLDKLEKSKREMMKEIKKIIPRQDWLKYNYFSMKDLEEDDFDDDFNNMDKPSTMLNGDHDFEDFNSTKLKFSFDYQPDLYNHPGPSPSLILQALTMSNANDGINLERLETIGDSFLKYAITTYLYCTYQNIHEGKLSHLRSKQVSNLNLYRLGRMKSLGSRMVAYKFEPYDNWLPPCHRVPPHLERALINTHIPSSLWNIADMPPLIGLSKEEIENIVKEKMPLFHNRSAKTKRVHNVNCVIHDNADDTTIDLEPNQQCTCTIDTDPYNPDTDFLNLKEGEYVELEGVPCFVPYNLITQHSIPDKSIADCVEALIGAYLIECGPRGALLFMAWLGIRVLPKEEVVLPPNHPFITMMEQTETKQFTEPESDDDENFDYDPYDKQDDNLFNDESVMWRWEGRIPGSLRPEKNEKGEWVQVKYGELKSPPSPLLRFVPDPEGELMQMLSGYEGLERKLCYRFKDRCYLLQAMTHASYSPNRLTDCYQRLEFLGDAVLDYLITRHLYEDGRRHSPGALTDLRSALVNNTIFASLAVRHGMHKYFRHLSPGLSEVIARFVKIQEENGHSISEEDYLIQEDECEQAEDVEVPKALGDLFESIAGAIFLDSGMSLDAVWNVYHALMQREIEAFSESVPKSPVRELLEMEPETAKFGKPEKLADGRRVRVTVEVLGVGVFKGIGRNYRIAKCTAAKCALRRLMSTSTRRHKNK